MSALRCMIKVQCAPRSHCGILKSFGRNPAVKHITPRGGAIRDPLSPPSPGYVVTTQSMTATKPHRAAIGGGLGLAQLIAFGTSLYLLTVLAEPIRVSTGWGLPLITGGLSIGVLVGAVISPLVGRRIGEGRAREVLSSSSLLFASGLTAIGLSGNLYVYVGGWILVGLGMASGLYDAVFSSLGRLYGSEARPIITSVALLGGFASSVFWPLSGLLIATVGWRATCLIYAALHLVVALPIYRAAFRQQSSHPVQPGGEAMEAHEPRRAIVWLTGGIFMVETLVATAVGVHLVNLLLAQGHSSAAAIGAAALIGPSQVAARFAEMTVGSRFNPITTTVLALLAICIALAVLSLAPAATLPAIILYGAGIGVFSIARGTLPLAIFGPRQYPVVMGRIARPIAIAQAVAPTLGAFLLSSTSASGVFAFIALIALCCVVAAVVLRALTFSEDHLR
jgi:MFS family permease